MARSGIVIASLLTWAVATSGCEEPDEPGFEWNVESFVTDNFCFQAEEGWSEKHKYRLSFEGASVSLNIGNDQFATGTISGCQIVYHSVVWMEPRDGYELRWKLDGEAFYRQGAGCENFLDDNMDWKGTETFTIVNSDHPDYEVGCSMEMDVQGTYSGQVE